jgi:hypothetical protein
MKVAEELGVEMTETILAPAEDLNNSEPDAQRRGLEDLFNLM